MSAHIDRQPDGDLDRVARIAAELGERIRTDDTSRMYEELVELCANHPMKAAQLLMVFAVWFDPNVRTSVLERRALHAAEDQVRAAMERAA